MSAVTISPGDLVTFNPQDERVILFDFDALNLPVGAALTGAALSIFAIKQNGSNELTIDNGTLLAGNRKWQARFLATTATEGDLYEVLVKGVTNESPPQSKNYAIRILIQDE